MEYENEQSLDEINEQSNQSVTSLRKEETEEAKAKEEKPF